jgi:hypothetical protein
VLRQSLSDWFSADGSLHLNYEQPNDQEGIGLADHVVPVACGDRIYMISEKEGPEFASAVNLGDEPRESAQGSFLMRRETSSARHTGCPSYLLLTGR